LSPLERDQGENGHYYLLEKTHESKGVTLMIAFIPSTGIVQRIKVIPLLEKYNISSIWVVDAQDEKDTVWKLLKESNLEKPMYSIIECSDKRMLGDQSR